MAALVNSFEERLTEVEAYLDFLGVVERCAQAGPPRLAGAEHPITAQQQKILYSGVYLQLYNLVESTMTKCVDAVAKAATDAGSWVPGDLCESLRKEWVRVVARTHVDLTPDNRLASALDLCKRLVEVHPLAVFKIEKGGGGNWDDDAIETISDRLGFQLTVSPEVYRGIKQRIKDDLGPLALVKDLRNRLAHGSISFTQCAEDVSVDELIELKNKTATYLKEVVLQFVAYIEGFKFLVPERRPL